jgi:hypothetical protein
MKMLNQTIKADLYGATIARLEGGQVYASLFVGQPVVDEKEENAKGISVMKMSCEESVYNELAAKEYPCPVNIHARLKKASGGKTGLHCFKLDIAANPAPVSKTAKS